MLSLSKKNIAVIGDVMLDKYIFGIVDRISVEAPIPIVSVKDEKFVPGGAANVAANIQTLGGNPFLFGVVGKDEVGRSLFKSLEKYDINVVGIVVDSKTQTTQKTRVIGHNQQLLRIDHENKIYDNTGNTGFFIQKLMSIENLDGIVISDYAKGVINKPLIDRIFDYSKSKSIPVFVDPKPDHLDYYKYADLVTPNQKEAMEMTGTSHIKTLDDVNQCGAQLVEKLNTDIIITRGDKGMSIFKKDALPIHIPTVAKEVYDVSGAGDTVIAALAISLCNGKTLSEAAEFANIAAGIKVSKVGTAPVYLKEIKELLTSEL